LFGYILFSSSVEIDEVMSVGVIKIEDKI